MPAEEAGDAAWAAETARLNGFHGLDEELLLFEQCSRFNHSCVPNGEYRIADDYPFFCKALYPGSRPFPPSHN